MPAVQDTQAVLFATYSPARQSLQNCNGEEKILKECEDLSEEMKIKGMIFEAFAPWRSNNAGMWMVYRKCVARKLSWGAIEAVNAPWQGVELPNGAGVARQRKCHGRVLSREAGSARGAIIDEIAPSETAHRRRGRWSEYWSPRWRLCGERGYRRCWCEVKKARHIRCESGDLV